jgi:hypothetical protein
MPTGRSFRRWLCISSASSCGKKGVFVAGVPVQGAPQQADREQSDPVHRDEIPLALGIQKGVRDQPSGNWQEGHHEQDQQVSRRKIESTLAS